MPEGRRQRRANPHLFPAQPPPAQVWGPRRPSGARSALHSMRGGLGQEPASLTWLRAPSCPAPAESCALISGGAAGHTAGTGARASPKAWATPGALGSGEALQTSTHLPISKNQSSRTPSHRPHECQPHFPPLGTSVSPAQGSFAHSHLCRGPGG